jgi:hypothetical protein
MIIIRRYRRAPSTEMEFVSVIQLKNIDYIDEWNCLSFNPVKVLVSLVMSKHAVQNSAPIMSLKEKNKKK